MEVELPLDVHLVHPLVLLDEQQVDQRRLVVGVERRPPRQARRQQLPGLDAGGAPRAHGHPGVEQVQRPLAIAEQEDAGVEGDPGPLLEEVRVAVDDEVAALVARERKLEGHVGEDGVAVHPPDPLHLRVRQHQAPHQRDLGPVPRQLRVEVRHVVHDVDAVEAAVVDLVLDSLEQVVVAGGVVAGPRRRAGDDQDPRVAPRVAGRELRVPGQPLAALVVPVAHLGAQAVLLDLDQRRRRREVAEAGRRVGGRRRRRPVPADQDDDVVGLGVGADLGEDALDVLDDLGVGRGAVGVAAVDEEVDSGGAAEDEHGDEAAEERDLDVVHCPLPLLLEAAGPQPHAAAAGHPHAARSRMHRHALHVPTPRSLDRREL
ncbi:hypothetical protein PVAP13_3NG016090 [Panicum virgatum]|uniref:Uncharacterized protein n=1 Tax=Panicum virgatum TaxID=38727 RepID=A0A8T0TS19_PANVG|nr:hypothetical protein PVAP13_3NG016090 [Panicum virgatum]